MHTIIFATALFKDAEQVTIKGKNYVKFSGMFSKDDKGITYANVIYRDDSGKLMPHLIKGVVVSVCGKLSVSSYQAKDGTEKVDLTIWGDRLDFINLPKEGGSQSSNNKPTQQQSNSDDFPF